MPHPGPKALISETSSTVSKPGRLQESGGRYRPQNSGGRLSHAVPASFLQRLGRSLPRQAQQEPPHPQLGASARTFRLLSDIDTSANRSITRKIIFMQLRAHAGIVADQFHLIAFGGAHIKRAPMHPCVFGGFDLQPQPLQFYLAGGERLWLARRVPQRIRAPSAGPFLFMARCPVPPT